jgi:translation initiation factor 2B subunit (eIF-2B alpha/beta/delta family)
MLNDKKYIQKLTFIREYVTNSWRENRGLPARYTLHDDSHSEMVERAIFKLIPETKYSEFSEPEKFYLLSSAWLHDIGMIPDLFGRKDDYKKVRSEHHIRSQRYIEEKRQELGLNQSEARIIGEICKYHKKSEDIVECQETAAGSIRLQLLASYLRLADAIHIDRTRVDESLFKIFLETGMPWDSMYHWLKSFWIDDVSLDFDNLTITIHLLISQKDAENVEIISNMIEEEVRTELYTVKDILIRGGISYFLDVKTKFGLGIEESQKIDLKQIIGNIQLVRKPSAGDVMVAIVDTILPILDLPDKRLAYTSIKTYQSQVIKIVVENRPCHMLASKINRFIENTMREDEKDLSDRQISDKINNIKTKIQQFKEFREESLSELISFTKAILANLESILLFGYSNTVIKALEAVDNEVKKRTKIYVCECGSKNQYNDMNELIYCDGVEYVSQIKKRGYEEIYLMPDILVGNLLSRSLVSKIIVGANGINIKDGVNIKSGTFGHTAGHLTIADLAHLYGIPVFVIVDSYKFGDMNHNEKLEKEINWITGDKKILSKLEGIKFFNPKEDVVDADKVFALVTDYGIFPADKIPDTIRNKVDII